MILIAIFAFTMLHCNAQQTNDGKPVITGKHPVLIIEGGDTYDWGKVTIKESPLKTTLIIKNTGDDTLNISEVKPACGCTNAPLGKQTLAPGDTTTLAITLNISAGAPDVMKTVRITSNDPANPNKILYLKATIHYPLQILPTTYFTFNEMKVGTEAISALKVKNNTDKVVKLSDLEIQPVDLITNVKNGMEIAPGQEIEVSAKYKPTKAGYFSCSVKVKTSSPEQSEIFIQGYGNVKESAIFNEK